MIKSIKAVKGSLMAYKNCLKCNRQYADRNEFIQHTGFVGIQKISRDKAGKQALELRNCSCGSTLAHGWHINYSKSLGKIRRVL